MAKKSEYQKITTDFDVFNQQRSSKSKDFDDLCQEEGDVKKSLPNQMRKSLGSTIDLSANRLTSSLSVSSKLSKLKFKNDSAYSSLTSSSCSNLGGSTTSCASGLSTSTIGNSPDMSANTADQKNRKKAKKPIWKSIKNRFFVTDEKLSHDRKYKKDEEPDLDFRYRNLSDQVSDLPSGFDKHTTRTHKPALLDPKSGLMRLSKSVQSLEKISSNPDSVSIAKSDSRESFSFSGVKEAALNLKAKFKKEDTNNRPNSMVYLSLWDQPDMNDFDNEEVLMQRTLKSVNLYY